MIEIGIASIYRACAMLYSKSSVFVHPHVVFQSPHSWDRLLKPAFLVSESTDHVWAEG